MALYIIQIYEKKMTIAFFMKNNESCLHCYIVINISGSNCL